MEISIICLYRSRSFEIYIHDRISGFIRLSDSQSLHYRIPEPDFSARRTADFLHSLMLCTDHG